MPRKRTPNPAAYIADRRHQERMAFYDTPRGKKFIVRRFDRRFNWLVKRVGLILWTLVATLVLLLCYSLYVGQGVFPWQ